MSGKSRRTMRPATTPEGRESQLSSLALDLAEKQLREGTASSQVVTHFLKATSTRERLEQERIQHENLLMSAKIEQISNAQKMEELYGKAIRAMREYSGQSPEEEEFDDDFDDY